MDQFAFGPHQADYGRTNLPIDPRTTPAAPAAGRPRPWRRRSSRPRSGASGRIGALPASCCGVVAVKPTFGRVPAGGAAPTFWSLDHVAPIARSVADTAALLAVLADGYAPGATAPPRLAVLAGWDDGSTTVREAIQRALDTCGAELRPDRAVPPLDGWSRMLMATVAPEAAVALSPYPRAGDARAVAGPPGRGRRAACCRLCRGTARSSRAARRARSGAGGRRRAAAPHQPGRWPGTGTISTPTRWACATHRPNTCRPPGTFTGHPAISLPVVSVDYRSAFS